MHGPNKLLIDIIRQVFINTVNKKYFLPHEFPSCEIRIADDTATIAKTQEEYWRSLSLGEVWHGNQHWKTRGNKNILG